MEKLYEELIEAYSASNLNRISGKLIELYKNKNYGKLREIANSISKFIVIDEEQDAKCFSRLIMLYHPDKESFYKQQLKKHYEDGDEMQLKELSHVLSLNNIDKLKIETIDGGVDYNPEYMWDDAQQGGYNVVDDEGFEEEHYEQEEVERSFYNAIKIREYGTVDMEFPSYYLEDIDEIEMAHRAIENLEGIEYCKHLVSLDLSNNEFSDISNLFGLQHIEELFLANNQIGYIDALSNMLKLKEVDLSGNQIDDISALFDLENLQYVNLTDNPVSEEQIAHLKEKGVLVVI